MKTNRGNRKDYSYEEINTYSLEEIDREIKSDENQALARYRAMVQEGKKTNNSSKQEQLYFLGR